MLLFIKVNFSDETCALSCACIHNICLPNVFFTVINLPVLLAALLKFQREKMENLKQDLESELRKLIKTRSEVKQMEKNMLERKKNKSYYNQQPVGQVLGEGEGRAIAFVY